MNERHWGRTTALLLKCTARLWLAERRGKQEGADPLVVHRDAPGYIAQLKVALGRAVRE